MTTLPLTARLIAAAAAVAITLTLLNTVFAIAEPQRSLLIAKMERAEPPAATIVTLAMGATAGARNAK